MTTPSQVSVWEDSRGVFHRTSEKAQEAEKKYAFEKEVQDIKKILLRRSKLAGKDRQPITIDLLAEVAILAYEDIKTYYGEN